MEQTEEAPPPPPPPPPPLPAGHETDCGEETDDAPETEEEELMKGGDELLHKNQGGQTSVSEKQMIADEKCSEEDVQDELQKQEARGWRPRSASTFSSPLFGSSSVIRGAGLPSPLLKQKFVVLGSGLKKKKSKGQVTHNILPSPGPSTANWNNVSSKLCELERYSPFPYIPSHSSSFDSTDELFLGESKKTYPIAADPTPGHSLDDTRETELYATAGPPTFQLSTKDDKDSDSFFDREKGVEGCKVAVHDILPRQEASGGLSSSASTCSFPVYGSTSVIRGAGLSSPLPKHQKRLKAFLQSSAIEKFRPPVPDNILPYPVPLDVSPFSSPTSNWSNVQRPYIPSYERAHTGYSPSLYIPSTEHLPTISDWRMGKQQTNNISTDELILGRSKKMYPTAADATPGHSQDDTRGTELYAKAGLSTFQPSTKDNKDSDSAAVCDRGKGVESFGSTVGDHGKPPRMIIVDHCRTWTKNSVQASSSGENQREQATHNILPDPGLSNERLAIGCSPPPYLQSYDKRPSYQSSLHLPFSHHRVFLSQYGSVPKFIADTEASDYTLARSSPGPLRETVIKTLSTAADATPGHSQDNTRGTASPGKPLLGTSRRGYFLPGSSSTQIHSDPQKPDGSAREEMFPSVTAGNYSTENPHLQQHSPLHFGEMGFSYSTSLRSQIPSAKNRTLTQAENLSDMPLDLPTKCIPEVTADTATSDCDTSENCKIKSAVKHKRKTKIHRPRRKKKSKKSSPGVASAVYSSDYTLDQPSPSPLRETVIKTPTTAADPTPGHSQDNTRGTDLHATAGPFTLQLLDFRVQSPIKLSNLDPSLHMLDYYSIADYRSAVFTAESGENRSKIMSVQSESASGAESDAQMEMETSLTDVKSSVTHTLPTVSAGPPPLQLPNSSCLPLSHSVPSLSQISSAENKTFRPSQSLPDMLLKSSFEEFTPDITVDEDDETYRFLCSCPGLYQCSVTGLVFHMEGEGDVVYRIVSWDRRLLAQHRKKPAGPLFDIKCLQQSVCRLHLPHCEIPSTAGCGFLSVAHLNDEGIEFIPPHKITETHVIINISGFSGFGNVKDEDSPPEPVRALVLLFYRPVSDQNLTSFLNVLMLPRNVVLRDVQRTRRKLVGDELYIETSSRCYLQPKQKYTLSTCPEDDSVLVQPKDEEFDEESYDNCIPSFQVTLKTVILNMKVLLRDTNSSHIVWEREVCLPSAGLKRLCLQGTSDRILKDIRSSFIEGISGPVLKSLMDKLLEKTVLTDAERESADEKYNREDKARFLIDTVRRKGASSEMIEFLRDVDPFLCKHLGLMVT